MVCRATTNEGDTPISLADAHPALVAQLFSSNQNSRPGTKGGAREVVSRGGAPPYQPGQENSTRVQNGMQLPLSPTGETLLALSAALQVQEGGGKGGGVTRGGAAIPARPGKGGRLKGRGTQV